MHAECGVRSLVLITALTVACSSEPGPGDSYTLRTINGRRLPTYTTALPPPDRTYFVMLAQEYHFISDTIFEYGEWVGQATVHQDSSVTYSITGCSQGFRYGYERRRDSIIVHGLLGPAPAPPHPLSPRIGSGGDLLSRSSFRTPWNFAIQCRSGSTSPAERCHAQLTSASELGAAARHPPMAGGGK